AEGGAGVVFGGSSEAGAAVTVSWGGVTLPVTANAGGSWTVGPFPVVPSDGTVIQATIVATDAVGNSVQVVRDVTVDTVPPAPATNVAVDQDNLVQFGQTFAVTGGVGSAEAGSTVTVAFGAATQTVTVAADGSWATPAAFPAPLLPGVYNATVTVADAAQNTTPIPVPFEVTLLPANAPPDAIAMAELTSGAGTDSAPITASAPAAWSSAGALAALLPDEQPLA